MFPECQVQRVRIKLEPGSELSWDSWIRVGELMGYEGIYTQKPFEDPLRWVPALLLLLKLDVLRILLKDMVAFKNAIVVSSCRKMLN